jgi:hypothetical protein
VRRKEIVIESRASGPSTIRRLSLLALPLLLVASACAGSGGPGSPGPSPTPTGPPRSLPALQLAVLVAVGGHLDYCDPDLYPVGHGTPLENARARFPTIEADQAAFQAILGHEHLSAGQQFTPDQLIAINEDYKQMQAIRLEPTENAYRFSVLVPKAGSAPPNETVSGTVTVVGKVTISDRGPGRAVSCPICLGAGVLIATPTGQVPVQDVTVGMVVWTSDEHGRRIPGLVQRVGSSAAPIGHEVVRLRLADGRTVVASPGHPTADGRTVGELKPGDVLDGTRVVAAALVPYWAPATYDLLPSGPTGTYVANGVLLGSTLGDYLDERPALAYGRGVRPSEEVTQPWPPRVSSSRAS